jgi:hypothetical protein
LNAPGYFPPGWFEAWDLYDKWKMLDGFLDKDPELRQEWIKKGGQVAGKQCVEQRKGRFDPRVQSANGRKSQKTNKENGTGLYDVKVKKMGAAVTNSQKWMCLVTGKISTAGPLSCYQKKRGIDKSLRKKVDGN